MTFFRTQSSPWKLAAVAALLALPGVASAEWALNMTEGVTPYSRTVYDLHMLILGVCTVIGIIAYYAVVLAERKVLHYLPSAQRRMA